MSMNISISVDGGSRVRRPGSEDHHRRQRKFLLGLTPCGSLEITFCDKYMYPDPHLYICTPSSQNGERPFVLPSQWFEKSFFICIMLMEIYCKRSLHCQQVFTNWEYKLYLIKFISCSLNEWSFSPDLIFSGGVPRGYRCTFETSYEARLAPGTPPSFHGCNCFEINSINYRDHLMI